MKYRLKMLTLDEKLVVIQKRAQKITLAIGTLKMRVFEIDEISVSGPPGHGNH
jgi:hypothetical protein